MAEPTDQNYILESLAKAKEQHEMRRQALAGELEKMRAQQTPALGISTAPAAAFLQDIYGGGEGLMKAAEGLDEKSAAEEERMAALEADLLEQGSGVDPYKEARLLTQLQGDEERKDRQDTGLVSRWELDLNKRSDQIQKTAAETFNQFGVIEEALSDVDGNRPNLARIKTILGPFARGVTSEVGVLTDQDVNRVFAKTIADDYNEWAQILIR